MTWTNLLHVAMKSFMTKDSFIEKPVNLLCKSMDWFLYDRDYVMKEFYL